MNDNHRKLIEYNIDKLVEESDYNDLIHKLVDKKVLTEYMRDIIEQDGTNDLHKNRLLWKKLPHRGPTAFERILATARECGYSEVVKILSASTIPASTFNNEDACLDKDNKTLSIATTRNMNSTINRTNSYTPQSPSNNGNNLRDSPDSTSTNNDGGCLGKQKTHTLTPYTKKTSFQFNSNFEVKRAPNFGDHPKLMKYHMKSKKRGVFFFVNIIEFQSEKSKNRNGAEMDRENLVTLFREMNFTIFYYEDLTRDEFFSLMRQLITSDYLKNIDSFIFCIQTHGTLYQNQTIMEFTDGRTSPIEEVINLFSNTNCKSLVNKPKVFFFPFCRGSISDLVKKIVPVTEEDGSNCIFPSFSDILICYGTVPGFMTHRDVDFGSWYVRELCKVFGEHACDCHLEEMLKIVGQKTMEIRDAGRVQVASTENRGFNKLMFFNPKIHE
jgi:hypothetical protein